MIEIELKARVADPRAVAERLAAFARYDGEFLKEDAYWHGPGWRERRGGKGFRIRREAGRAMVTWKEKRLEGGMERSREREFSVGDAELFSEFARRLGCEPFYAKRKVGSRWFLDRLPVEGDRLPVEGDRATPIALELLEVPGLGHFLEIEALITEDDGAAIARARDELRDCLRRTGLPEDAIEPRTWSELLSEAGLIPRV